MACLDGRISCGGVPTVTEHRALVLVTSSFPTSGDGSEAAGAFVADLAEELSKHVQVRVVAPGTGIARESWSSKIDVFRYKTPNQPLSTLRVWHPADALKILHVLREGSSAVERAVAVGPTQHILALWALPCGGWARKSAKRNGISYSVWTLGSDIWSLGRIPLVRSRLRTILRDAKHCWSDGLKLAEDTRTIARRDVEFLPSTRRISAQRITPLREQPPYRLLFLGRWHPNKGVDLLLEALGLLSDDDWTAIERVDICGGGPLADLVHVRVLALAAAGRPVYVRSYLDRPNAEAAMLDADWLLIPSRIESIPVVFSDAMKLGTPVIAMPTGDLPALIGWGTGVLSDEVGAQAFAEAMRRGLTLNQDPAKLQLMSSRFDIELTARRIVAATTELGSCR